MTTMTRWDPFQDLRSAQDEMAQMSPMLAHALGLHTQQGTARTMATAWAPALDISERKDAYLVTVELPGLKPEDLDITMEDGLLTIQGERQFTSESSEQQYHRVERRYGAFRRSITLPAHVTADGIQASSAAASGASSSTRFSVSFTVSPLAERGGGGPPPLSDGLVRLRRRRPGPTSPAPPGDRLRRGGR